MIKKIRQGRVVEFVDESILPSRQAAVVKTTGKDIATAPAIPASKHDIESSYAATVERITEEIEAAAKAEMNQLGTRVAQIEDFAKTARSEARGKLRAAKDEAERRRREAVQVAEKMLDVELSIIRTEFQSALAPVYAEVEAVQFRKANALHDALQACAKLRDEQLAALAEAERLDAKMAVVADGQEKDEPAPTSPGESTTSP